MTAKLTEIKPQPNKAVIELLEGLLENARSGEIVSIGAAFVMSNGRTGEAWYSEERPVALVGSIRILERVIVDASIDLPLHEAGDGY